MKPSPASNMPSQIAPEERIANTLLSHLVGTFKIPLAQTENHPDQRPLDREWVAELKLKIGEPEILNRGLHPIDVLLKDDEQSKQLKQLVGDSQGSIPDLPEAVRVLVFAGQHRLAMLQELDLDGSQGRWWHGKVYLNSEGDLMKGAPSNAPQVLKLNQDADVFRSTAKMNTLLRSKQILPETYRLNRQALWGSLAVATRRGMASLSRNQDVTEAVVEALGLPHIARVFVASTWGKATRGRLHGVTAGLVKEMVCQVRLLTNGALEVPAATMELKAAACHITKLEAQLQSKDRTHPWECLEGGLAAALQRVRTRSPQFVSNLNPTKTDPWTLPHLVLAPGCLGLTELGQELDKMHTAILHMFWLEVAQTEVKGMNTRTALLGELATHKVPQLDEATKGDYERLVQRSRSWWELLRKFKVSHLPTGMRLTVPKAFEWPEKGEDGAGEEPQTETPGAGPSGAHGQISGGKRSPEGDASSSSRVKRSRRADDNGATEVPRYSERSQAARGQSHDSAAGEGQGSIATPEAHSQQGGLDRRTVEELLDEEEYDPMVEVDEEEAEGDYQHGTHAVLPERVGGDRMFAKALEGVEKAARHMTRKESRALNSLLNKILVAQGMGKMAELAEALDEKAGKLMKKLKRSVDAQYDEEVEANGDGDRQVTEGGDHCA
ncbi:hypothetical protein FRC09_020483 [Ceratobasidium sp. 395]|nr:hypothetical protein FRC09_020483 [Ceratobasidium sp. 395]